MVSWIENHSAHRKQNHKLSGTTLSRNI